jgi:hypothetical protein
MKRLGFGYCDNSAHTLRLLMATSVEYASPSCIRGCAGWIFCEPTQDDVSPDRILEAARREYENNRQIATVCLCLHARRVVAWRTLMLYTWHAFVCSCRRCFHQRLGSEMTRCNSYSVL